MANKHYFVEMKQADYFDTQIPNLCFPVFLPGDLLFPVHHNRAAAAMHLDPEKTMDVL